MVVQLGYEMSKCYELIYQLEAIEYLFVYFQLDMFRAYTPIFRSNGCYNFLHIQCSATRHQHTHSSRPTPNYTKDTICCICKEIITSIAPEDRRVSPKHVRAESTQINTQLHQVGKLIHISNQNARYNYPKFPATDCISFVSKYYKLRPADCHQALQYMNLETAKYLNGDRGGTVVKALCYESEGRWFDPSWGHWNFSLI